MSYLGGKKLAWGNTTYFEGTPSSSPYLNYHKWNSSYSGSDYTYAYAVTTSNSAEDINYSSTSNSLNKRIWRESDVVAKMTSDGTSYYGDGYTVTGAYGASGNSVPYFSGNLYVMQYGYNSRCTLIGIRFALPFYYGGYSAHTISSQNNSKFYFALIPSTSNPSGYTATKTFSITWRNYSSNSSVTYTSNSTTSSTSGTWFKKKITDALGQSLYTGGISYLSSSDHTMQIRSGTNSNAYYILILYRIDYQFTFSGSARPSHLFLRVSNNHGTAVDITSKSANGRTYNIPTDYRKLQTYYNDSFATTVNSLNYLFKKRLDPY